MGFFGMQMQRNLPGKIPGTTNKPQLIDRRLNFNRGIIDGTPLIDQADGLFTITRSGNYYVSWFITLKTGLGDAGAKLTFSNVKTRAKLSLVGHS